MAGKWQLNWRNEVLCFPKSSAYKKRVFEVGCVGRWMHSSSSFLSSLIVFQTQIGKCLACNPCYVLHATQPRSTQTTYAIQSNAVYVPLTQLFSEENKNIAFAHNMNDFTQNIIKFHLKYSKISEIIIFSFISQHVSIEYSPSYQALGLGTILFYFLKKKKIKIFLSMIRMRGLLVRGWSPILT